MVSISTPKELLGSLAAALDIPGFPWKRLIIGFSFAQYLLESYLSARQHQKLKGKKIPKSLEGAVTQEVFDKSQAYGRAKSSFGFIKGFISQVENFAVIYYDVLPKIWAVSGLFLINYAPTRFSGEISQSIVFFVVFNILTTLMGLPISYYSTFVIEEKFGFNKQTRSLFFTDIVKGQVLTAVLGAPILAGFLKIVQSFGGDFFYYLWVFGITVQAFMITIYPIFILPIFNKLSPLEDGQLKTSVEALATRLNFPLKHLYSIDGSKRSAHSNAYFYGLPWSKHIVIYDTLMEKSSTEEVVAVLAHELGHWSLSHTTKLFGIAQFHMFYIFALFSVFINNKSLYRAFGFHGMQPIIIGFILFGDVLAPMDTVVKLAMNVLSRKFEYQADEFAVGLGYSTELAKSLIKLQVQNLATMDADWLYSSYHYTHPILPERLAALGWKGGKVEFMGAAGRRVCLHAHAHGKKE
ncbi:putative CAAX prenyl protease 1 [Peziza echinospora]|nr:putative CAAX prenyl protease 1 [Peziza echinospora]